MSVIASPDLFFQSTSFQHLIIDSSLLPSVPLPDIYTKLISSGSLTITNPQPNTKRQLLFSGFCKISEENNQITCLKPASTAAVDLKAEWQKALEPGQDLVNEDNLLEEDEEYKTLASEEDCLTRAKPCKNCTCGRADELKNQTEKVELSSSCGRCHLGDAFRCAGCPFRGTPAFVPGQRVDDLGPVATEKAAKIEGGKVLLEI